MDFPRTPGEQFLSLTPEARESLWAKLAQTAKHYYRAVEDLPVLPRVELKTLKAEVQSLDFAHGLPPDEVLDFTVRGFYQSQLQTSHPCYFGVFNPHPSTMGIVGDTLASLFNAQLASYTSSPFAIEVEQHLIRTFGALFGWERTQVEGCFTTGGMEANHTALLLALQRKYPSFAEHGARSLSGTPVAYVSAEGHHSFRKAARLCGLGSDAIREVPVTPNLQLDTEALAKTIERDRQAGALPVMAVATIGTTNAGVVDPIAAMAAVCRREGLTLHLDAAWGGAAVILPELKDLLSATSLADSVTLDAHKWLSVPMTAGMLIHRHKGSLENLFRVDSTHYMPASSSKSDHHQPYAQSMQWSRRFLGLKLFMTLATAGFDGYAATLRHQIKVGERLRERLRESGWEVLNETKLPVVCFRDPTHPEAGTAEFTEAFAAAVGETGETWVTTVRLSGLGPALRAGISNFRTTADDIERLVGVLARVRVKLAGWRATAR